MRREKKETLSESLDLTLLKRGYNLNKLKDGLKEKFLMAENHEARVNLLIDRFNLEQKEFNLEQKERLANLLSKLRQVEEKIKDKEDVLIKQMVILLEELIPKDTDLGKRNAELVVSRRRWIILALIAIFSVIVLVLLCLYMYFNYVR